MFDRNDKKIISKLNSIINRLKLKTYPDAVELCSQLIVDILTFAYENNLHLDKHYGSPVSFIHYITYTIDNSIIQKGMIKYG